MLSTIKNVFHKTDKKRDTLSYDHVFQQIKIILEKHYNQKLSTDKEVYQKLTELRNKVKANMAMNYSKSNIPQLRNEERLTTAINYNTPKVEPIREIKATITDVDIVGPEKRVVMDVKGSDGKSYRVSFQSTSRTMAENILPGNTIAIRVQGNQARYIKTLKRVSIPKDKYQIKDEKLRTIGKSLRALNKTKY